MALLQDLQWRYATKKYDSTKKVAQSDIDKIVESVRLAPTSSGLQQFKLIVITNQELKEKIVPIAWGQQQVADCSHLLVFAAWDRYTAERIDTMYDFITDERSLPRGQLSAYTERLKGAYLPQSDAENFSHTAHQTYIGLGIAMVQAAELKVDSTPMEGFSGPELDKLLNLNELGLKSVSMLALGYRDTEGDWLVNMKKVRVPKSEFIIELK